MKPIHRFNDIYMDLYAVQTTFRCNNERIRRKSWGINIFLTSLRNQTYTALADYWSRP